ncbi:hypothetical protein FB45DRAFT_1027401 [Roridomyces roridus]|uniref:CxC2-like cysteine cluster KDZ transposase-associated domain-containing protein n=1 Tax=Roridomyces roridus TaxID=1738132 RepID=A0AAD7BTE3_9AGAR|nr:hypothetical protein FB45DRAFT_1027401 [Roridomyces roridus]
MPGRRRDDTVHFDADVPDFVADTVIEVSTDGQRNFTSYTDVRPQKRPRNPVPEDLDDFYAGWTPVLDEESTVEALADTISSLDIEVEEVDTGKRKRYENSDDPMGAWRPHAQSFLDRMMRRHYIGRIPKCGPCGTAWESGQRIFRCVHCGEFLQCAECLRQRHALTPLHHIKASTIQFTGVRCSTRLQEWTGTHWTDAQLSGPQNSTERRTAAERSRGRLSGVGLVYQLGHGGFPCQKPGSIQPMVVVDTTGVFTLDLCYCGCRPWEGTSTVNQLIDNAWYPATVVEPATCATFRVLEEFCLLNVVGNVSVNDYIGTLERMSDPLMSGDLPDRYKAFGRMTRQYDFLQRAARTGWAQTDNGLSMITPGGMAVLCWSCPHRDMNLPEGWQDVPPKYRFLYMIILALDANFRLKNRLRANERHNPSLAPGKSYFVETDPYKAHLKNYVAEKDVSSCIAFAALLQKDTRVTKGLRVSGVGGCVCARHGVVRPLGMGDLQKGERYANMDYILLSALTGVAVLCVAISYDIACQWKIHLATRAESITETTQVTTNLQDFEIQYGLPVWHAAAHEINCQMNNSLSYAVGVGRTDGEGIERTWAVLNPAGYATKEMGEGARHDSLETKVDHINFEKNIKEGDLLSRKLIVAIAERNKQVENFKEVNSTLEPDLRKKWRMEIEEWQQDHSQRNPYVLAIPSGGISEGAVLRELKEQDAAEAAEGNTPASATQMTAPAFLKAGLQIEDAQRRIKSELKGVTIVSADRSSQIQELRLALLRKFRTYETLQDVYMPGVALLRREAEALRDWDAPPPKAEDLKLWLPSELSEEQRRSACRAGLGAMEARLREGQCADALKDLRARLHTQRFLVTWRNANAVGQKGSTRSATLIGWVGDRIQRVAMKYRQARSSLIAVKGEGYAPHYKELRQEDLSIGVEEESDSSARKQLARLGSRKSRNEPAALKKHFSWIWTVAGGPNEDDEAALHDSVQVEWSKARARRDRWVEEVELLREEMRRTMRMLRYIQEKWGHALDLRPDANVEVAAGARAYGQLQIAVHHQIAEAFFTGWNRSMATAVKDVIRQDGTVYREILDGHGMDNAPSVGLEDLEEAEAGTGTGASAASVATRTRSRAAQARGG